MAQLYACRHRAPTSGPVLTALGLALGIYLECRFRQSSQLAIRAAGRDACAIPLDETNLIWRTAQAVAADVGGTLPPIELEIQNDIPLGKGLGSSAAALTAGVVIADHLLGLSWRPLRILNEAARIEGHPDNVAACVLGSIVASAIDSGGSARAVRLDLPPAFGVAVVVPDFDLPTTKARAVLPQCYSREDAIFNVQRAALLVAALADGLDHGVSHRARRPPPPALPRARWCPAWTDILKLRAPGLLGCVLSGAGPSILVFYERGYEQVCDLARQVFAIHGHESEILWTEIAGRGYELNSAA